MSEHLRNFVKSVYALDAVVQRAPADAWHRPSPCTEWTAREVLGHVIWGLDNIASRASGGDAPAERSEAEVAGPDPVETWNQTRDAVLEALDRDGALQQVFVSPFGEMSIDGFLGFYPSDVLAHTWDIATAMQIEPHLPVDLCERGAIGLAAAGDSLRRPGLMAAAVPVAGDADALTRFIALSGRNPG